MNQALTAVGAVAAVVLDAVAAWNGTLGRRTESHALTVARQERDDRLACEIAQGCRDAEQPIRDLRIAAVDQRVNDSQLIHAGGEQPITWALQMTNGSAIPLFVRHVTTHPLPASGGETLWGTVAVNRTLGPYETVTLAGQRNAWTLIDGTAARHREEHEALVRDESGREWTRYRDHHVEQVRESG